LRKGKRIKLKKEGQDTFFFSFPFWLFFLWVVTGLEPQTSHSLPGPFTREHGPIGFSYLHISLLQVSLIGENIRHGWWWMDLNVILLNFIFFPKGDNGFDYNFIFFKVVKCLHTRRTCSLFFLVFLVGMFEIQTIVVHLFQLNCRLLKLHVVWHIAQYPNIIDNRKLQN